VKGGFQGGANSGKLLRGEEALAGFKQLAFFCADMSREELGELAQSGGIQFAAF
jgi:hypothetical protein